APGQVFNIKTYQQDVLKINSYYDKIGFGGQLPSHVTDVNITPDGVLTLKIQEGLTVRNVIITQPPDADPVLPESAIRGALVTKPGLPYSDDQREKDYDALKTLYKQYDLQIGDMEAGVDPATIDQKNGTADVRYSIYVARVGAIEITGNTKTHDDVIRRELRLRPGMVISDSAVRRDYDRLNNLGFFEKVELNPKPGPDPKRPGLLTLNWQVKEQRTGTATIGAGYSGGLTGTGLTGTLSYQENNINGTGDGGSIRLERGARVSDAQLSISIPYLGKTPKSQRWSFGGTLFTSSQTNYYPVYLACSGTATGAAYDPATGLPLSSTNCPPATAPQPVAIVPPNPTDPVLVNGVVTTYESRSQGVSLTVGRRLSDVYHVSLAGNIQQVAAVSNLPSGYFYPNPQALGTGTACISAGFYGTCTSDTASAALGISAPSLAQIDSTKPYNLRSIVPAIGADSRDDVFNPRRGALATLSDEWSSHAIGSAFDYQLIQLDVARFFPTPHNSTLGLHFRFGTSTGAIPTNKLYIFSDQELRGYSTPFYGTDILLGQAEIRVPLTPDRKFSVVGFVDSGGTRIRGGTANYGTGQVYNLNSFTFHNDVGVGLRFDVPQLGLHTLRLDFAKGSNGTHTSFGIGQSF
ncbi:MAG: BamA/TamA family outer membrane protein, partial [Candidatus Eremiobacteraeota bacterium]|nr:BamA/TamA family outer membrane protein [Candidatus Eremiobacteraeota bacterium]